MAIEYRQQGDYLIPEMEAPEAPQVGKYGMLRLSFLKESQTALYNGLILTGELNAHLEEIDRQANEMMDRLTKQQARREGVDEQLKAENQLEWGSRMESIRNRMEETVLNDLVYS